MADAQGLTQHARFVFGSQVREQTGPDVDAFANVKRQVPGLPVKGVDARTCGGMLNRFAQVLRVLIGPAFLEVFTATAGQLHKRPMLHDLAAPCTGQVGRAPPSAGGLEYAD